LTKSAAADSAAVASNKYAGFSNSEPIRKGWCKLLKVLITRRTSWLRNADDAKKSLSMSKELTYGKLTQQIKHDLNLIFGSNSFDTMNVDLSSGDHHHLQPVKGLSVSPLLSSQGAVSSRMLKNICDIDYWKIHDANTNNSVNRVWVLYAKRQHEYAVSANKINSKPGKNKQLVYVLLCLINLCSHEYDVIRHEAIALMSVSE
jgi:hypothetical protein